MGMSSLLSGEGSAQVDVSPEKMLLGMGLIVASQVCLHSCATLLATNSLRADQTAVFQSVTSEPLADLSRPVQSMGQACCP